MHNTSSPEIIKITTLLKCPPLEGYSSPQFQPSTANTLNSLTSLSKSIRNSFKGRPSNVRLIPFQYNKNPIRPISKTPSLADLIDTSHSPSHSPQSKDPISFADISPSLFSPPSFDFESKTQPKTHSRTDSLLKLYSCSQDVNTPKESKTPMRPSKLLEQLKSSNPNMKLSRANSPAEKERKEVKEIQVQEEIKREKSPLTMEKTITPKLKIDHKNLSIQLVTGSPRKNIHKMNMLDKMKRKVFKSCGEKEPKILTSPNSHILEMAPSFTTPVNNSLQHIKKPVNILNKTSFANSPQHMRTKSELSHYNSFQPSSLSIATTPQKISAKNFLTPKKESAKLGFAKEDRVHTEGFEQCQLEFKGGQMNSKRKFVSPHSRTTSLAKIPSSQEEIQARKLKIQKLQMQKVQFNNQNIVRQELTPIKVKGHVRDPNPFLSLEFSAEKKEKNPKDPIREAEAASKRAKLTGKQGFALLRNRLAKLKQLKLSLKEVMTNKVFSSMPYEKEGAVEFISAAKLGNVEKLERLIENYNKYLVYDFTHIHQTALHFAVKKGFFRVALYLIQNGADIDAKDMAGRTPLYFAIDCNHMSLIQLLLGCGADPWVTEEFKYDAVCEENTLALSYLIKAKMFHVILHMTKPSLRMSLFRKERFIPILEHLFLIEKLK